MIDVSIPVVYPVGKYAHRPRTALLASSSTDVKTPKMLMRRLPLISIEGSTELGQLSEECANLSAAVPSGIIHSGRTLSGSGR